MKTTLTILILGLNTLLFAQENIDLFIWAGQSNALGMQGDAAQYPVDTDNLDNQIRFNWTVPNGGNSGGWTTMEPQDLGHYFPDGHFGPEVTFSRKLVQSGYNPAIFKFTQGATSIFEHWLNPGDGGLYDDMIVALNTAITELENQGHTVNIQGLIWIQGESDSNSDAAANAYFNNLTTLLNDFRTNVVSNVNLPILLGVDEQYFDLVDHQRHQILNTHQDIALNDENIKFTSMYGYPKADVTHLTPEGLISHGEDLFNSYQLLISGEYPSENCTLSSEGNHVSFARTAWGQSFTTDCSGMLANITFESLADDDGNTHTDSATFTLYNGADCSGTVLSTQTLNEITAGDNVVYFTDNIYLDKEHTYYFDIVSDTDIVWQINFSDANDTNNVFGVLRWTSDDGTENCGSFGLDFDENYDFDMDFSVALETSNTSCADDTNIYPFIYDGKTYEVVKEGKSWMDAATCAVDRGGILAEINSQAEQDAIFSELQNANITLANTVASNGGGASYVWIGGNDLDVNGVNHEGIWIWDGNNDGNGIQFWDGDTTGNPVDGAYTNWGNEPDNAGDQDGLSIALTQWPIDSGSLGAAGQWNDLIVDDLLYYVIEYPTILLINDFDEKNITLYPNPVNNLLNIKSVNYIKSIQIYNHLGQTIKNYDISNNQDKLIEIDLSDIIGGIYFVKVLFDDDKSMLKKIIKE